MNKVLAEREGVFQYLNIEDLKLGVDKIVGLEKNLQPKLYKISAIYEQKKEDGGVITNN